MNDTILSARTQEVLRAVVNTFIETGEPVGSRTLSKKIPISLSPATIRNIMSDLADAGFITKPHASAGRLPTDLGYRVFVDALMDVPYIRLPLIRSWWDTQNNRDVHAEKN